MQTPYYFDKCVPFTSRQLQGEKEQQKERKTELNSFTKNVPRSIDYQVDTFFRLKKIVHMLILTYDFYAD